MRKWLTILCVLMLFPLTGAARPIIADLAIHSINIDTSFRGLNILLFGAREDPGDIVVVVKGPEKNYMVRKKERVAGFWVNRRQEKFDNAYSFYAIASSRPIEKIDNQYLLSSLGIGNGINWKADKFSRAKASDEFTDAMLQIMQNSKLYPKETGKVSFWGETLFRTNIKFPDNIPEGRYAAEVYLISDGELASVQITPLYVKKVGFEAFIHDMAHKNAVVYGLLSVFMALAAGWIAGVVFQRVR